MSWRCRGRASAAGALQRKGKGSFSLLGASTLFLFAIQAIIVTSAYKTAKNGTAYVSLAPQEGSSTLLSALLDNSIQYIVVQQPEYNVRQEFEPHQGKPIEVSRNITISGADGLNCVLDLDFVASAVQLCPMCRLTFTNITVANERHGIGEAVDFVVGATDSGAAVLFLNSNKLRLVCSDGADAAAVIQQIPRSSMLAGKQQVDLQDVSFKGAPFPSSLHMIDVALTVPHETIEGWKGGSGGYTLIAKNVTRLCSNIVDQTCLTKSTPEACVTAQMDELRAAAGSTRSASTDTVGKTVGVAVGAAVAGLALLTGTFCILYLLKKRRCGNAKQSSKASRRSFEPAAGQGKSSKVQSGGFATSGYEDDLAEAGGVDVDQLRMFDSFIEGCNFVRAPLGVRKGWEVSKVLTSPSAEAAPTSDRKDIQLGQFLGAGSFGRVYRAKWGGRDVAVKVIEHNSDASSAVESEVELMFKFSNHPNIVRAFYAITYTQHSTPTLPNGTGSSSSLNLARDTGGFQLNSSAGSSSNNRVGVASNGSGQRAALARLRSLPLQEIVNEDAADSPVAAAAAGGHYASSSAAAAAAAAGAATPDRKGLAASRPNRLPPLERVDSDDQPQDKQQQQQQLRVVPPASGMTAAPHDHGQGSRSDPASAAVYDNTSSAFAGSTIAVRDSSLGSTDCVSRVYSWMGSSGIGLMPGGQFNGGKRNSESSEGLKQCRAETWLVQEFCDLGTLGGIVAEWNPAEENDKRMLQRLLLLQGAAEGLKVLHSMNTVHGDLTARNVLVASSREAPFGMVAKLADLGLSRVIKLHRTHRTTNTVGTLSHMPPELLRYGHCSTAVDIYAFGVMMWELYTNKAAFNKLQYGQFYETVVLRNLRPLVPPGMPADFSLLMQHCWASDAMQRPNVDRVLHCLRLMISERQGRLSDLSDTAAARVQSAPLPRIQLPPRLPHNMPPNAALSFSAKKQIFAEAPDGVLRHWSCPGPGGLARPLYGPSAAAAAAAAAAMATAQHQQQLDETAETDVGIWKGPPSRFSWGDRSGLGCSTPSVPLRPPLPLLHRYVSDEYGMDLAPQEERWFV